VPHRSRPEHKARNPVLVTWRFCVGFPNLRAPRAYAVIMTAIALARDRLGMRIVEFSIQRDHIHLILEAEDAERLGKALRALGVRLARRLNALFGLRGSVLRERYHLRTLTTPKQVRNALAYVLCNFHKHRENLGDVPPDLIDECSSGLWFDGWDDGRRFPRAGPPPVSRAQTWLLRFGWKRWGLVRSSEVPSSGPARTASSR
jgi:REP element-mobilizing transposase RayT